MSAQRKKLEAAVWNHKHRDFRGKIDGQKTVLMGDAGGGGTRLVFLDSCTDAELVSMLPQSARSEFEARKNPAAATIVKGNKVVATADSVKEAQTYAKKVGGKVLVPASNPPARKNGSAQWTRAQVVDQIRKNIAAMSDSTEPDYEGIEDLRRMAKLVAANDGSVTWDNTHWRKGLDGVKLIEDGNAIYALRGHPAGGAASDKELTNAEMIKQLHDGFARAMKIARKSHPEWTEEQVYQLAAAESSRQLGLPAPAGGARKNGATGNDVTLTCFVDNAGILTAYDTNEEIRKATASEKKQSDAAGSTGAFRATISQRTLRSKCPKVCKLHKVSK
jgi:hypothetical protein